MYSPVQLVAKTQGLSLPDAARELAEWIGMDVPSENGGPPESEGTPNREELEDRLHIDLTRDPEPSDGDDGAGSEEETSEEYVYRDAAADRLAQKVRRPGKQFRWERWTGAGWSPGLDGMDVPLYHLPLVRKAVEAGDPVWVVEGERDVLSAMRECGVIATCNPEGAGSWPSRHTESLAGAERVNVVADNDLEGWKHAANVARELSEHVGSVQTYLPAVEEPHADLSDHIEAGYGLDDLRPIEPVRLERKVRLEEAPLPILTPSAVHALPEPGMLVEEVLPEKSTGALFGEEGIGKSFGTLDIACSVATGTPFHGREVEEGKVVYLYAEGATGLKARLHAWEEAHGLEPGETEWEAGETEGILFVPTAVDLSAESDEGPEKLAASVRAGGNTSLVVLDTLAKCFNGDENNTEDMNRFTNRMNKLRESLGATVLAVHHVGWTDTDRERGSRSLRNNSDFIIRAREVSPESIELSCEKMKDAPPFADFQLRKREVVLPGKDRSGKLRTSLVLDDPDHPWLPDLKLRARTFVAHHPGCSWTDLRDGVEGRYEEIEAARDELIEAGEIRNTGRKFAHEYRFPEVEIEPISAPDSTDEGGAK